ncbi:hypothetical protein bcere0002_30590 [Bacillus cereus ATCC 10876]|nr:hypothetical protein bcere0002_30590 [Bacillus cereus ATCC 10876]
MKVRERMAYSKAQNEATKNYKKRNPEQTKYLNYKTMARSFIKNLATQEDLDMLKGLMAGKEENDRARK